MSDDEQQFSLAQMGARTCMQQAGTIRKNGYIVIKGRPCRVVEVSTSETGKHGHHARHFVSLSALTSSLARNTRIQSPLPTTVMLLMLIDRKDYPVSVSGANGTCKDDLRLPDGDLGAQLIRHFDDGKKLAVSVVSAMEEENTIAFREVSK